MSDFAIQVESLGKRYRLGEQRDYYLRDLLGRALRAPKRLLSASRNGSGPRRGPEYIWAIKDISFNVREGEVVGLIGRNGAGKSTLLKILARITRPTEGHAQLHGRVGSLLEVGTGFHYELTGRENVYLSGAILGMSRSEINRKFDEIVAFAEVERFLGTPLKHYSSGMAMRLAFAVAAHLDPEILLVDEVLAVGDAAFQKKCIGKMNEVAKEGRTIVFVSHNMTAMRSLCSRAFLIEGGQAVYSGPVGECIDRYLCSVDTDISAEIVTANLRRPPNIAHDQTLRITRVRFETSSGQALLYSGRPVTLEMDVEVTEAISEVVFGFAVHSGDGTRIFECRSTDSYGPIKGLTPGKYSIRGAMQDNLLNPGLYRLGVGARCEKKGLDWLPDVATFRVELPEELGSLWLHERSGMVRQTSEWSLPTQRRVLA